MQNLQTLVRNLAMILLLASFLEMLLPNKSMRGFVQLIMGLFVISAVLGPAAAFLHVPLTMEIPAWSAISPEDLPALATEAQGLKAGQDAVQEQYRQILVHQIEGLALSTQGVRAAAVKIQFADRTGGVTDQPIIAKIEVSLTASPEEITPVQPIIIGPQPDVPEPKLSPQALEVQTKIAALMNLPKEKITIQEN